MLQSLVPVYACAAAAHPFSAVAKPQLPLCTAASMYSCTHVAHQHQSVHVQLFPSGSCACRLWVKCLSIQSIGTAYDRTDECYRIVHIFTA